METDTRQAELEIVHVDAQPVPENKQQHERS